MKLLSASLGAALIGWMLPPTVQAVDRGRTAGDRGKAAGLTGTWQGERPALAARGVEFDLAYTSAVYANVAGGMARGVTLEGTGDFGVEWDLGKLAGWKDARVRVSTALAHGASISAKYVGDVNQVSDYDIPDGFYLHEIWWEQGWLEQRLSLRVGKLSADFEFPLYGWADAIPLPLYPLSALAARLHFAPTAATFANLAVYDGDPNEPGRTGNRHGVHLRLARSEGATLIGNVGLNLGAGPAAEIPAGTWMVGLYHSTRDFADVLSGAPRRGNDAFFAQGDQMLWRENPAAKDNEQGLGVYLLVEAARSDRNTYRQGGVAGVYYTGLLPGRDRDMAYFSLRTSRFGERASRAAVARGDPALSFETTLQLYYQIAVTQAWSLQPEINHVIRPGGSAGRAAATVLSVRTNLIF